MLFPRPSRNNKICKGENVLLLKSKLIFLKNPPFPQKSTGMKLEHLEREKIIDLKYFFIISQPWDWYHLYYTILYYTTLYYTIYNV